MKVIVLAAAAGLLVSTGAAFANGVTRNVEAAPASQATAPANPAPRLATSNPLRSVNATGLPAYEMRSNGLMINGLLPAYSWEG